MELLPESQIEGDEVLESFESEDGKHLVVWSDLIDNIPEWVCITHMQLYYLVCAQEVN